MASNREQEHNSAINFSIFKSEPTQTKRSDVKQISLEGDLKRQESSPACLLSPTIDYNSQRRSSAPTIDRPVGSNKYFYAFINSLTFFLMFVLIDFSFQLKNAIQSSIIANRRISKENNIRFFLQ